MPVCIICQKFYEAGREMTCSDQCHQALVNRLVAQFGEFKMVVRQSTGIAYRVPTRDIIESELREQDLDRYPLWDCSPPDDAEISVREAGRRGGLSTSARFRGTGFYREIGAKGGETTKRRWAHLFSQFGKKGGRPRRPSLEDTVGEGSPQKKEDAGGPGDPSPSTVVL